MMPFIVTHNIGFVVIVPVRIQTDCVLTVRLPKVVFFKYCFDIILDNRLIARLLIEIVNHTSEKRRLRSVKNIIRVRHISERVYKLGNVVYIVSRLLRITVKHKTYIYKIGVPIKHFRVIIRRARRNIGMVNFYISRKFVCGMKSFYPIFLYIR